MEKIFKEEFDEKYRNTYIEDGVGTEDVIKYPATKTHKEIYPELYNFVFYFFNCNIKRCVISFQWLGYVRIYHSVDEDSLVVHGGITFYDDESVGFDAGHHSDLAPFEKFVSHPHQKYRDRDYMIKELEQLCKQLYSSLPKWNIGNSSSFPPLLRKRIWDIYKLWYLGISKIFLEKSLWIEIISLSLIL